eukprot:2915776-Rhodomonas_salina.2
MRCPVLTGRMLLPGDLSPKNNSKKGLYQRRGRRLLCDVRQPAGVGWGDGGRGGEVGTAYGPTRCPVLTYCMLLRVSYGMSGSDSVCGATTTTRCPVLTQPMLLRACPVLTECMLLPGLRGGEARIAYPHCDARYVCYAVSSTDLAYGATTDEPTRYVRGCSMLTIPFCYGCNRRQRRGSVESTEASMLPAVTQSDEGEGGGGGGEGAGRALRIVLCACAMRCCYARASRCPVLTPAMLTAGGGERGGPKSPHAHSHSIADLASGTGSYALSGTDLA